MKRKITLSVDTFRAMMREAYMDGFEDGVGLGQENVAYRVDLENIDPHWRDSVTADTFEARVEEYFRTGEFK